MHLLYNYCDFEQNEEHVILVFAILKCVLQFICKYFQNSSSYYKKINKCEINSIALLPIIKTLH